MKTRKLEERDLVDAVAIWNGIVAQGGAFPQEEELDPESARQFFAGQSHCGVVEDGGRIVGLYILHPNNVGRCGHICNASYAVDPRWRGRGAGRALVEDSLRVAASLGFRIMQFNAVVASNPARGLYEKLGFHDLGKIPGGFRRKDGVYEDICLYYRKL